MNDSKIEYAVIQHHHVLRLEGDVRYQDVMPLHEFLERLEVDDQPFILDLSRVTLLDSTALGILAMVAKRCRNQSLDMPVLYVVDPAVRDILLGVCFDQVFKMTGENPLLSSTVAAKPLEPVQLSLDEVSDTVKVAHEELADIDEKNRELFKDVNNLLAQLGSKSA
ncbi:STAS domain-containing protein [Pleionea sp. CnH1-48]|uniref:STAS domain-containing protein n=1 Tax=Pleionea sp. CnH1-48 TaxID=2954494 RepID=UPI0020985FFB|nr:STAS domain-containing protein [Pleionea sp. CnH1-48]MCO7223604.1 STAS domain-containing protein [Pleionea sp. CnH1-48]